MMHRVFEVLLYIVRITVGRVGMFPLSHHLYEDMQLGIASYKINALDLIVKQMKLITLFRQIKTDFS